MRPSNKRPSGSKSDGAAPIEEIVSGSSPPHHGRVSTPAGGEYDIEALLARHILKFRRKREALFARSYFADPAWDIMLDLFNAQAGGKAVATSSLLIAATVPPSTGLRRIRELVVDGILTASPDPKDGRRTFVSLAPHAFDLIAGWLSDFGDELTLKP